MKPIEVGQEIENGASITITPEMRKSTHMHIIGGSGKGKSKFLEHLLRQDIKNGQGFCLIDWHGTLYKNVLRYCSQLDIGLRNDFRKIILINPSQPDFVTGFNPFMNQGLDISTQVNRRVRATIRPWGVADTNEMPTFERLCKLLYTFAAEHQETLINTAHLLSFGSREIRSMVAGMVSDSFIKRQWQELDYVKTFRDWNQFALSTENRFFRFLSSTTIKRFMGMKHNNIDLLEAMDNGHIVLINLGESQHLESETAKIFASLLLNEFFESSMIRSHTTPDGQEPRIFNLYLDEFQEYITDDIAAMLDQVRKGGLHLILAHQHLDHLKQQPRLLSSVLANARIRAVFGGLPYEEATMLANQMFLSKINERQIKRIYHRTLHLYREEMRTSHSTSIGISQGTNSNWTDSTGRSNTISRGQSISEGEAESNTIQSSRSKILSESGGEGQSQTFQLPSNQMFLIDSNNPFLQTDNSSQSAGVAEGETHGEAQTSTRSSSQSWSASESHTQSQSSAVGGGSNQNISITKGQTETPVFVPVPVTEIANEAEWTREEKVSRIAEMLIEQPQQHCFIKIDTNQTEALKVPFVKSSSINDELLHEYENQVYAMQGAIYGNDVDTIIKTDEQRFLTFFHNLIGNQEVSEDMPEMKLIVENDQNLLQLEASTEQNQEQPKNKTSKNTTKTDKPSIFDEMIKRNPKLKL